MAQASTAYWIGVPWNCAGIKIESFVVAIFALCTEPMKEEAVFSSAAGATQAHVGNSYEIFRTLAANIKVKKDFVKCGSSSFS